MSQPFTANHATLYRSHLGGGQRAIVKRGAWEEPRIFAEIQRAGAVPAAEMEYGFNLGLGTQVQAHIEKRFSMPWSHPVRCMREFVEALQTWSVLDVVNAALVAFLEQIN